jgi:hypothetical protein
VLEGNVKERRPRLSQDLVSVSELAVDVNPPPAAVRDPGGDAQAAVDQDGPPVAYEDPRRDRRESVPGGEQPASLVQCPADEASVGDPGRRLVALAKGEGRLVALDSLFRRERKVDAMRIVATTPARRVVVGRDVYRRPPRSKCAL